MRYFRIVGLDAVELVMAVEERFGIRIADEEANGIYTAGDLYGVVMAKLDPVRHPIRPVYRRVQRAMAETLGVDARTIRPSTPLASLIPRRGRRRAWQAIEARLGLTLPALVHPTLLVWAMMATGAAVLIYAARHTMFGDESLLQLASLAVGAGLGKLVARATEHLAFGLPGGAVTVGCLVKRVRSLNYSHLMEEAGDSLRPDVWEALCRVIARTQGIERSEIVPESRLSEDLGIE